MKVLKLILGVALIILPVAHAAETRVAVESLQGEKKATLTRSGKDESLQAGQHLQPGDVVKTGAKSSTRLIYPDGSQFLVGRASTFAILPPQDQAQSAHLKGGQVRAVIAKQKTPATKHRFMLKTSSAVMGVRGTDFTAETAEGQESTEVHTLDGQVDVAKDENELLSGKGVTLLKNQFTQSKQGLLSKPEKFDRSSFLKNLSGKQPDFDIFMKNKPKKFGDLVKLQPVQDAKTKVLEKAPATPQAPELPKAPEMPKKLKGFGR